MTEFFKSLTIFLDFLKDLISTFSHKNHGDLNTKRYKVLSPIYAILIDKNELLQSNHGMHASDEAIASTQDLFNDYSLILMKNDALLKDHQINVFLRTMALIYNLQSALNDLRYNAPSRMQDYQNLLKTVSKLRKKVNRSLHKCRKVLRLLC
ncbi:MAG: hypothetical protein ABF793_00735 [Lacticaseibacillus paracasei]